MFFWYSSPGNSFMLLPHEPAVVYMGALYPPVVVAVVGGLATMVAATVDYVVIRRILQLRRVAPIKETRVFTTAVRLFSWQPWWTIVAFAFSPVPFYPVRVLAPGANYPMARYVSAVVVGRVPRYFLIALGGAWAGRLTLPLLP